MIKYDPGYWGVRFILSLEGSVFLKTMCFALPNAALAVIIHILYNGNTDWLDMAGVDVVWAGYTFVLGFLIVFRNDQAYKRFWRGARVLNGITGNWHFAAISLVSFCSQEESKREVVTIFKHKLARILSMLHCCALQSVTNMDDDSLEIINTMGFEPESLMFLQKSELKFEVLQQWLHRTIVDGIRSGAVVAAPPIVSGAFRDLSDGDVFFREAKLASEVPFPFPYAQMITCGLIVHWVVTPLLASQAVKGAFWAGVACLCVVGSLWSLLYIALEIDQPFGDDPNDLPLAEMQQDFNKLLLLMLDDTAQASPLGHFSGDQLTPHSVNCIEALKATSEAPHASGLVHAARD